MRTLERSYGRSQGFMGEDLDRIDFDLTKDSSPALVNVFRYVAEVAMNYPEWDVETHLGPDVLDELDRAISVLSDPALYTMGETG